MNDRQMRILESLSSLEILTRTQIQRLHDTKSIRNTNYVMQSLNRYIDHIRLQENAYFLNKRGRTLLGVTRQFKYNSHIHHKLMRNDAYVYFRPQKWKNEQEVSIGSVTITPDAYFKTDRFSFLEVDNTQKWHVNEKKIENYQKFYDTGAFQRELGYFPELVWVVKNESRVSKLKHRLGIPHRVIWYNHLR